MEKSIEVKTFLVRLYCDKCQYEMKYDNSGVLVCNPPKYVHKCTNCNHTEYPNKLYPFTTYLEIDPLTKSIFG